MKNNKKIIAYFAAIIGLIGIIIPYVDILINFKTFSKWETIGIVLVIIAESIRKKYHRGDEIEKIFENATEEEKEKIYNYIKQIEEKQNNS